jgi:hypothetical protein
MLNADLKSQTHSKLTKGLVPKRYWSSNGTCNYFWLDWGIKSFHEAAYVNHKLRSSSGSQTSFQRESISCLESTVGDTFSSLSYVPMFKDSSSKHCMILFISLASI